jgi:hypothetical protein
MYTSGKYWSCGDRPVNGSCGHAAGTAADFEYVLTDRLSADDWPGRAAMPRRRPAGAHGHGMLASNALPVSGAPPPVAAVQLPGLEP